MTEDKNGKYVEINGLKMYYEDYGSGIPIILLHGGLVSARLWENWGSFLPILSSKFRVIAPDSRGHGKSNNPAGKLSYKLMCDDIIALIKELKLDHPFIFGYSDGGQIALEIGIEYPDVSRGLVAGGVVCEISEHYTNSLRAMGFNGPGDVDFDKLEKKKPELISLLSGLHSSVYGPDYWKELVIIISKMWLNPDEFPGERVSKISVPTLVLHGDRDEGIPLEDPLRIYRMIPKAELSIIPNADHLTFRLQSDVVSKIILNFIKRHKKI